MNKKEVTLFIVEDDDIDYMTIERSLNKKMVANTIVRAKDGQEALEMLDRGEVPSPYIILLDIQMPRMNGLEFLKKVRSHPVHHKSVIFMLTTSKNEKDILQSYENHSAGYFVKEETGHCILNIVETLEGYWKVACLPE